ncbi:MAG: ABC transporter substrate-binding protein [Flavobacteriales bacterium]|nr:ABC transporter substrate-binding protein [Flavobacteriales bacterium]
MSNNIHTKSLLFFTLLIIVACDDHSNIESDRSVFYYNEAAGITSLDPAFANNQENIWWVNQVFDGLVEMDDSMKVVPLIARSWEVDRTATKYTFHLRDDVFFHDNECFPDSIGRRVIAQDFVYSFERIRKKRVISPGIWIFSQVREDEPFIAINDNTLEIHLQRPFAPFLSILSMQYCSVIPKEAESHFKNDLSRNPVGTGPFKLNFWLENNVLALVKNERFFQKENGDQLPFLDAVKVNFVRDKSAMYLDFLKGKYDMISSLHPSYKDELLTRHGDLKDIHKSKYYLQKQPYLKTDYLGFQLDRENHLSKDHPFQNKLVRQALNLVIDRKEMVLFIKNNTSRAAHSGFVPPAIVNKSKDLFKYEHDPNRAKELLKEAGYEGGKGIPEIPLATTQDYVDLCEYVQNQFMKIGVKVNIEVMPTANQRSDVANGRSIFFRKSWIADYADAENFLGLFYSKNFAPNGSNYTHFQNEVFDELYSSALASGEQSRREQLYSQMDSILSEEAPVIPLFYDEVIRFVSKDISGLNSNAMNLLDLKRVKKAKRL